MQFEINNRIKVLIEDILKITPYEFSKSIGNKRPDGLYQILKNETEPSPKTLNKIFEIYPKYKVWLLTGSDEDSNNSANDTQNQINKSTIVMEEKKQLGILEEALHILKRELQDKQRTIDALTESNRDLVSFVTGNTENKKKEAV